MFLQTGNRYEPLWFTTQNAAPDDGDDEDTENDDDDTENDGGGHDEDNHCALEAVELNTTTSRYDDWLHRGPFLADLPWLVYMVHVQRTRKPMQAKADYSQLFFFDEHYALSVLYCQEMRYSGHLAIPRIVGSVCPPMEEDSGEAHARYKLMLFSRTRCPGKLACADPMICRAWMVPSEDPDDLQIAEAMAQALKSQSKPVAQRSRDVPEEAPKHARIGNGKPKFASSWKACKCEL